MNNFLADREKDIYSYVLDIGKIEKNTLTAEQTEKINQMPNNRFIDLFCCIFHKDSVQNESDWYEIKKWCNKVYGFENKQGTSEQDLTRPKIRTNAENFSRAMTLSFLSSFISVQNKQYPYREWWEVNLDDLLEHAKNYTAKTTTATPATTETASINTEYGLAESIVKCQYPQFAKDYKILLDNGVIAKTEKGLKWVCSKQSLAEYFGLQYTDEDEDKDNANNRWQNVQKLFNVEGLRGSFSAYKNGEQKPSKDYVKIKGYLEKKK